MTTINEYLLISPNWEDPVSYKRRWQTGIQTSIDGTEKRSALLTWPRRTLSFSLLINDYPQAAYFKRKLYKNLHNVWGIPFWPDKTKLTVQASSGQKILNIQSTQYRNFEVGAPCILFSSQDLYEVGTIQSFTSSQITLVNNLVSTWPTWTEIYPVLKCRLRTDQALDMITSHALESSIEAVEEFDDGITRYIGIANSFPLYKGGRIFNLEPDWGGGINQSFIHPYDLFSPYGKSSSLSHYDETEFGLKMENVVLGKSDIQKYLDFFDAQKGRWGNFWLSSWQADIRVTLPFGVTDTQLTIASMGFPTDWLNTKAGANLILLLPDASYACLGIINAASLLLTLDGEIGLACPSGWLRRLLTSFLYLARFNQDEIEVQYITDEMGQINLSFKTLFKETLEEES